MQAETTRPNQGPAQPSESYPVRKTSSFALNGLGQTGSHRGHRLIALWVALVISFSAFAGNKKQGISHADEYDSVQVDQMIGNNVSGRVFERVVLCLNARRETRQLNLVTNQTISLITNINLVTITNQTVTATTNESRTLATNLISMPLSAQLNLTATNGPSTAETKEAVTITTPQPLSSTNYTVTEGVNTTFSKGNNQLATTVNFQALLSRQITTSANNLSITTGENQAVFVETNQVITTSTNQTLLVVTNLTVTPTNLFLRDYYVYVELTPPPDFTLQNGESLVLLVDGARYGFAQTNSQTAFVSRRGFTSSLYKVPPEVLVEIANAKEVKIRLKGVNSVIEREMSQRSRNNFKQFLMKYFVPEPASPSLESQAATDPGLRAGPES